MPQQKNEICESGSESRWIAKTSLPDGRVVRFRHLCEDDHQLIAEAIRTASAETLLHRFFSPIRNVSPSFLRRMLQIDPRKEVCLVGVLAADQQTRIICGARYVVQQDPTTAEIAITIHDDFQRCGLGSFLLNLLLTMGRERGIQQFEAYVMASNVGMMKVLGKMAPGSTLEHQGDGIYRSLIPLS